MILSLDPGAARLGWAVLDWQDGPIYVTSGIIECPRGLKEKFQVYRLRLIQNTITEGLRLLTRYDPETVVNEIVPAVGGGKFIAATQSELAKVAITTMQTLAFLTLRKIVQLGATTIKKRVGGSKEATKVQVRNGVIEQFPELQIRKPDWVKIFDEPDAIATGLAYLRPSKPIL